MRNAQPAGKKWGESYHFGAHDEIPGAGTGIFGACGQAGQGNADTGWNNFTTGSSTE